MCKRHMEICSLIFREMQIKTTLRHHLTSVGMTIMKKKTNKYQQGCGVKATSVYSWWECKFMQPLTLWRFLKKLKVKLLHKAAIPLLGLYLKEAKILIWKIYASWCSLAALFTIAKTWKQPKCPSADEWIKMWYINTMEQCSVIKKQKT